MRLKKEVRKLRKQVYRLNKKLKVYKWKEIKPKIEVSSASTQTGSIEHLFEARELFLQIQKWKSATNEHKKETKRVQEQVAGIFKWYIDQLDRARQRQERQQTKIKELEEQVKLLQSNKEKILPWHNR